MNCSSCGLDTERAGAEPKACGTDDCDWPGQTTTEIEIVESGLPCRRIVVCNPCYHVIHPDMWINRKIWEDLKPVTPYEDLPIHDHTEASLNERKIESMKEPGRWEKKFPKVEMPSNPGKQPTDKLSLPKWNEARKIFNESLFGKRRHHMAIAIDTLEKAKGPYTPEQHIAYILGVSYLNGELDQRTTDADGPLSILGIFS